MKLKKKVKMMIVMSIAANLLSGCDFGETKIEHERLVKALDEGDMKAVMSASDDGYAYVKERSIYGIFEEKEDGTHSKTIYQTTEGIYNTIEKKLFGETTEEIATNIKNEKEKADISNYKEEEIYHTNIMYEGGEVKTVKTAFDVSAVKLIMDRLQGIKDLKPSEDTKGFDEPNIVSYSLTESQFQQVLNDKLKLEYDEFIGSSIGLHFNAIKDSKKGSMGLLEIRIAVSVKKENVLKQQQIFVSFNDKKSNNKIKEDYLNYQRHFNYVGD
ncbi:DUF3952 domain-containing protein [Bacillus mycoides]|jgi:hypothetical protein|uniref:DUF3952 domain-containing protein n=2 Tax=Bacillus mycoides TaxID=1405 RepID=UPI0018CF46B5|nr:DUF3952 domain-containing protein [Bacillus mycoides]MBG9596340.1 hypothetical protein [Bacillus mycoides]